MPLMLIQGLSERAEIAKMYEMSNAPQMDPNSPDRSPGTDIKIHITKQVLFVDLVTFRLHNPYVNRKS